MAKSDGPQRRRRLGALALTVLLLGVGFGLAAILQRQGLQTAANWAQLASIVFAAAPSLPLIIRAWRPPGVHEQAVCSREQLDQAQQILARLVLKQWREEIGIRRLDDPAPLAVRWRLTELPVMDHPGHLVRPMTLQSLLARGRPRFTGRTDRISDLAAAFRGLTRRRLVVAGDPGMGKTTLAVLLLRQLLQHPLPGEPVPVMVPLTGWDPATERFRDWLARGLAETYPALCSPALGPDLPLALVTERRVLPILDGLDELPEPLRPQVLSALNDTFMDPLILTCRMTEYRAAVHSPGGDVLTAAAVIEPRPLRPADAAAYLTRVLPPRPAGAWPALLDVLARDTTAPLTRALATPLTLWLVRRVYVDTGTDPAPLLSPGRFTTPGEITDHLFDHLVQAVITTNRPQHLADAQPHHPFRPHRSWAPEDARRWLSFLADHLDTGDTTDLAWWRVHQTLPRRTLRLLIAITGGLTYGFAFGLVFGSEGGAAYGITFGVAGGLTVALLHWPATSTPTGPNAEPAYADLRLRGRIRSLIGHLAARLAFGLVFGLMGGLVGGLVGWLAGGLVPGSAGGRGLSGGLVPGLMGGLVVALAGGLAFGLSEWAKNSQASETAQTPPDSLHRDLRTALLNALAFGLTGGLAGGLVVGVTSGPAVGLAVGLAFGLTVGLSFGRTVWLVSGLAGACAGGLAGGLTSKLSVGLAVGLMSGLASGLAGGLASSSVIYLITLTCLSVRRRTPVRLMAFLQDAHRLGLLRQTGAVYQFRHIDLQKRLAALNTSPPKRHAVREPYATDRAADDMTN